jgi:hypothetical protein
MTLDTDSRELRENIERICRSSSSSESLVEGIIEVGDSMVSKGKFDDASAAYHAVLTMQPDNEVARTKLVHLNIMQWRFKDAARILVDGYRRKMK